LDPAESLERLLLLFKELDELSQEVPVIVEGRKDKKALEDLDITGEIIVLNDGTSVLNTCERLSERVDMAVILTDWDHKGGQLARALMDSLEACDMKHETDFRARISYLTKKETKDVEGLPSYLGRLRRMLGKAPQ